MRGQSTQERFDDKWTPEPYSGCWLWFGAWTAPRNGYGTFFINGRTEVASRASWMIHKGEIPKGMEVCHHCDTRPCVNPDHLFVGTRSDNMMDCSRKGRIHTPHPDNTGERNRAARFNEGQVRVIRNDSRPSSEIAKENGVKYMAIYDIKVRKTWKHVI